MSNSFLCSHCGREFSFDESYENLRDYCLLAYPVEEELVFVCKTCFFMDEIVTCHVCTGFKPETERIWKCGFAVHQSCYERLLAEEDERCRLGREAEARAFEEERKRQDKTKPNETKK